VVPGVGSTIATFLPTNRLNRVDLPTLGRPTNATRPRAWNVTGWLLVDSDFSGLGARAVGLEGRSAVLLATGLTVLILGFEVNRLNLNAEGSVEKCADDNEGAIKRGIEARTCESNMLV
jgi:hypothetical protein